jgi:pyruvate/2-oxoglutarate dehydrogenase complex dihydrolipoamide dehydrogenase (E3) component
MKALVDKASDSVIGFTAFGVGAGEIMSAVQVAIIAGLSASAMRDVIFAHPTLTEGLSGLFSSRPTEVDVRARIAAAP